MGRRRPKNKREYEKVISDKTIYGEFTIIDLMNYKHSFIINIRHKNKNRQYFKDHKRRMSNKSFLAFEDIIKAFGNDFKQMFLYLENNEFKKIER